MGLDPSKLIDHIDRDKENNHRDNLRSATYSQNAMNSKRRSNNTSGVTGVHWRKDIEKWAATIKVNYKSVSLGCFDKIEAAEKVRKKAEIKYFGGFTNGCR